MKDDSQTNNSIWMATADMPSQSRLVENIRTDVCSIGAGQFADYVTAGDMKSAKELKPGSGCDYARRYVEDRDVSRR